MADRFINAAKDGYVDILREGSRKDLNTPDEDGMTATLWAAENGNLEALRLIVGREGDVNKSDYLGMTAIHHAVMRGHMSVVSYLVNWGCNVYALDNDLHSALDLAVLYDRHEIVRFLDAHLAEKQAKNPKQASRMKEEAIKVAESNIKRYEKLTDHAAKIGEKEHRKLQVKLDQQLNQQNGNTGVDNRNKPGFFTTLTRRIKGGPNSNSVKLDTAERRKSSMFSDASMTYSGKRTGTTGLDRRIQMRRLESLTPKPNVGMPEFKVGDLDDRGNRTNLSMNKGFGGSASVYVTGSKGSQKGELTLRKREFSANISRAKSESELLDSGTDSYYGETDEDQNNGRVFNRPDFTGMTFLPKSSFLNTVHSFDDSIISSIHHEVNGDSKRLFGENADLMSSERARDPMQRQPLPWEEDDLANLDDEEDGVVSNELSAVNMFLWSCGLASYLHIFAQEKIDMQVLTKMTDSELKELGLPFGPRKKLQEAITKRNAVLETPTKMTETRL